MTNPVTGYPDGYLLYLVKQVEMGMRRPFEELVGNHGITAAGYTALTVLRNRPGITSSELARRSFVRAQTMAETVAALATAGLIRRQQDPDHGRQILLFITEVGLDRIAALADDVSDLESRMLSGLHDTEPAELLHALRAVRDALADLSARD